MKKLLLILLFSIILLSVNVNAQAVPTPDFSAYPYEGYIPLSVAFIDNSTENPTYWIWNFGDGNNSTLQNPIHTYNIPGSYQVALTAGNEYGNDTLTQPDYITVNLGLPHPAFTYSPPNGPYPLTVFFNSSLSTGLYQESYNWSFGDGTFSTEANPQHVYQDEGSYTVVLRILNSVGQNMTFKMNCINVSTPTQWYAQSSEYLFEDSFNWLTVLMIVALLGCIACEWIPIKNEWKYVYRFALTLFAALISTFLGLLLFSDNIMNPYNGMTMQNTGLGFIYLLYCVVCWCAFVLNLYDYYVNSKLDEAVDTFGNKRKH